MGLRASHPSAWRRSERGFLTLIGLLVVIVIIGILFALYFGGTGPKSAGPAGATTTPGRAVEQARDVVCRNNLAQIRAAIQTYVATSGAYPPSLESLEVGIPLNCPVGGEPYVYDPATGQVHCVHPGHGRY